MTDPTASGGSASAAMRLRALIVAPEILVVPGCFDALSALLIERTGFGAAYLSGASLAYTRLGLPDVGFLSASDVARAVAAICDRTALPLIVDADTGFGNAVHAQRTVRNLERAGAAAIQLEDQQFPKRCGHLAGKSLISVSEMAGKVRAACDARHDPDTVIIARTDAVAVDGVGAALERAERYLEAGADVLFIEAVRSEVDLRQVAERFARRAPLLANMVEGGETPLISARELQNSGFALSIYPGSLVRAFAFAATGVLESLRRDGDTCAWAERMFDFKTLQRLLGTDELLAKGRQYDAGDEY